MEIVGFVDRSVKNWIVQRFPNSSLGKHIPPVLLYQEDVFDLAKMLTKNNGNLRVTTKAWQYDSLDELLLNQEDPLDGFCLSRTEPTYISIDFDSRPGIWLYSSSDDLISRGIFSEIEEFLESKKRLSFQALSKFVTWAGQLGVLGIVASITFGNLKDAYVFAALPIIELGFIFVRSKSVIHRTRRAETYSFWQRNKDQLIVALIAAMFGSLITLALTP